MVMFGVRLNKPSAESKRFLNMVKARLRVPDMIRNPFIGAVHEVGIAFYILDISPIYPAWVPRYGAVLCLLPPFLFSASWPWYVPGVLLAALGLLWTRFFFFLMMRAGLKKAGYRGHMRLLRDAETLRAVMNLWDK